MARLDSSSARALLAKAGFFRVRRLDVWLLWTQEMLGMANADGLIVPVRRPNHQMSPIQMKKILMMFAALGHSIAAAGQNESVSGANSLTFWSTSPGELLESLRPMVWQVWTVEFESGGVGNGATATATALGQGRRAALAAACSS